MTLTERAQRILELQAKASPGPWRSDFDTWGCADDVSVYAGHEFIANLGNVGFFSPNVAFDAQPANGAFIAAAHESADLIRELLAENERLRRLPNGWRLRAISLEQCGVMLAGQTLRECAAEIDSAIEGKEAKRTSWFAHEGNTGVRDAGPTPLRGRVTRRPE